MNASSDPASNDRDQRPTIGRIWRFGVVFALVLALVDALVSGFPRTPGTIPDPFSVRFPGYLGVWLLHAALLPAVAVLSLSFPVRRARDWPNVLVQLGGAISYPILHLALLSVFHRLRLGPRASIGTTLLSLLPQYFLLEVMVYVAMAGAIQLFVNARQQRQLERAALALQAGLAEARLDALRRQLSPHFLFNALNTVTSLVRQNRSDAAIDATVALSSLLRYLLDDASAHEVPLEKELAFLERYMAIERMRFVDRLDVVFQVDRKCHGALVPRFVLQPLAENAIRHGIGRRAGPGRVEIGVSRYGDELRLRVLDDGPGPVSALTGFLAEGIGLRNTRDRLHQLYGMSARLEFGPRDGGGAMALIVIPFQVARPEAQE